MKRAAALLLVALTACSSGGAEVVHASAVEHGRALFADPRASTSPSNVFSCATCHPGEGPADRIHAGSSLAGVTSRRTFWGGARVDLLEAINECRTSFMDARAPWAADDPDARAMWAYLASREGSPDPAPFTAVRSPVDLAAGDPAQGKTAYALACRPCHGSVADGEGKLASFIPRLPGEVDASHASLAVADRRRVYLRKIREGTFATQGGSMPPFSREALSDADVASILAFLGQY